MYLFSYLQHVLTNSSEIRSTAVENMWVSLNLVKWKTHTLLNDVSNIGSKFLLFKWLEKKIGTDTNKNVLSDGEFRENPLNKSHTFLSGLNKFLLVLFTFILWLGRNPVQEIHIIITLLSIWNFVKIDAGKGENLLMGVNELARTRAPLNSATFGK